MDKFEKAKLLIGTQEVRMDLLGFYFELVESRVKNFCHIDEIPAGLEPVVVQMVAEFYRGMEKQNALQATGGREVTSISRGDTSISYGAPSPSEGGAALQLDDVLTNHVRQLYPFRRLQTVREGERK